MSGHVTRRSFLEGAVVAPVAAPFISRWGRASAAGRAFDADFGTARAAVEAIRAGVISSTELTTHVFRRIARYNPQVNAFLTLIEESAKERAAQADRAMARGETWGPLHGLPILTKDAFSTEGVRTTSSHESLEGHVPTRDAVAVARLKKAGAVLVGKTNMAWEAQSYNDIVGTSNNPWDLSRTPGGSTGGGAAALAAGLGFLELGSDTGGSIRIPSTFCGLYGHKPSLDLVPLDGHFVTLPPRGEVESAIDYLTVAGPLARSAEDLRLELEVIAGPGPSSSAAYRWDLPAPRRETLREYRLGYVLDDPFCPVSAEAADVLARALDRVARSGVELVEGWPDGVDPQSSYDNYMFFLWSPGLHDPEPAEDELGYYRDRLESPWGYYAKARLDAVGASYRTFLQQRAHRRKLQLAWSAYFESHDAFIMPISFVPAFPHDQTSTFWERTVATSSGGRSMADIMKWPHFANVTGCPSTVAPAGGTQDGLPVGFQILGPFLEDGTCLDIAQRLAPFTGGFTAPPGYGAP